MRRCRLGAAAASLLFVACVNDGPTLPDVIVARIAVRGTEPLMRSGDALQLRAVALNARGDSLRTTAAVWRSSAPEVLSVDASNVLLAGRSGTAWVIASAEDFTDSVRVAVVAWLDVAVADSLAVGDNVAIGSVQFVDGTRTAVAPIWSVSDGKVLRLDNAGRPRAVGAGSAWLTANLIRNSVIFRDSVPMRVTLRPMMPGARFARIATSFDHTCGLTPAGAAHCFGANTVGQLGIGCTDTECPASPTRPTAVVGGSVFAELDVGAHTSCGIRADGIAMCWGDNTHGQVGSGTIEPPFVRAPATIATSTRFTRVAAGPDGTTCLLATNGTPWCFGRNDSYQSGRTPQVAVDARVAPIANIVAGLTSLDVGLRHACATGSTGTHCWGAPIGYGPRREPPHVPVRLDTPLGFTQVAAGRDWTCGLTSAGAAYCWGGTSTAPAAVASALRFREIARGGNVTCGITTTERLFCWGYGPMGSLGNLWTLQSDEPLEVWPGRQFVDLAIGESTTNRVCVLDTMGIAYCW